MLGFWHLACNLLLLNDPRIAQQRVQRGKSRGSVKSTTARVARAGKCPTPSAALSRGPLLPPPPPLLLLLLLHFTLRAAAASRRYNCCRHAV
jgi:hypothetical protein